MVLLISSILESVFNPSERFSTLKRLEARGVEDDVVFSFARGVLRLKVVVDKQRWILSCHVDTEKSVSCSQLDLINGLSGVDKKYLAPVQLLEREMLVFDNSGQAYKLDVLLTRDIEGETFAQAIIAAYADKDLARFDNLRKEYVRLLCLFLSESNIEFKLRWDDIFVDGDSVKVVNYEKGIHTFQNHLAFALLMVLLRSDIPFKICFGAMNSFPSSALRSYLPVLRKVAAQYEYSILDEACEVLENVATDIIKPSQKCDLLKGLADLNIVCGDNSHWNDIEDKVSKLTLDKLLNDYDYFSRVESGLIVVERQECWGYVDTNGREVIALEYDWAGGFEDSYAVVMRDDLYGLIDAHNNIVVPIEYETLEWNGCNRTILASVDGYFGVMDVEGNILVPFEYRWLSVASATMFVASRDQKYGYIDLSGSQITPFIYDDAYAFCDGRALVVQGGDEFLIDTMGQKIVQHLA